MTFKWRDYHPFRAIHYFITTLWKVRHLGNGNWNTWEINCITKFRCFEYNYLYGACSPHVSVWCMLPEPASHVNVSPITGIVVLEMASIPNFQYCGIAHNSLHEVPHLSYFCWLLDTKWVTKVGHLSWSYNSAECLSILSIAGLNVKYCWWY